MGAVTGDHSFLKIVTMATMNPPNNPIKTIGPAALKSRVCRNELQVHAAVAMAHTSRMPVLFTVPFTVMRAAASIVPPFRLPGMLRKVFGPRAGLEVFVRGMHSSPICEAGLGTGPASQESLTRYYHSKSAPNGFR